MFSKLLLKQGLSLERLNSFYLVYKNGGISKTAPNDPIRQTLIGRQIRELESFFETKLTNKKGKIISLNVQGIELGNIISKLGLLLGDFKAKCSNTQVRIKISSGGTLMDQVVAPKMSVLTHEFPQYLFHFTNRYTQATLEGLHNQTIDFGILWKEEELLSGFKKIFLGDYTYRIYIPKKLIPHKKELSIETLNDIPLVYIKHRNLESLLPFDKAKKLVIASENEYVFQLIESENYAGILPFLWGRHLDKSKFTSLKHPSLNPIQRKVYLCYNPSLQNIRNIPNNFIEKIHTHLKFKEL
jgi:DNA-binding transcriptional LysR family regulator